jgi:hypothetical protein
MAQGARTKTIPISVDIIGCGQPLGDVVESIAVLVRQSDITDLLHRTLAIAVQVLPVHTDLVTAGALTNIRAAWNPVTVYARAPLVRLSVAVIVELVAQTQRGFIVRRWHPGLSCALSVDTKDTHFDAPGAHTRVGPARAGDVLVHISVAIVVESVARDLIPFVAGILVPADPSLNPLAQRGRAPTDSLLQAPILGHLEGIVICIDECVAIVIDAITDFRRPRVNLPIAIGAVATPIHMTGTGPLALLYPGTDRPPGVAIAVEPVRLQQPLVGLPVAVIIEAVTEGLFSQLEDLWVRTLPPGDAATHRARTRAHSLIDAFHIGGLDIGTIDAVATVIVDPIAHLDGIGVNGAVSVMAIPRPVHMTLGLSTDLQERVFIAPAIAVPVHVPGRGKPFVDFAVTVVVNLVARLVSAWVDQWLSIVAIPIPGRKPLVWLAPLHGLVVCTKAVHVDITKERPQRSLVDLTIAVIVQVITGLWLWLDTTTTLAPLVVFTDLLAILAGPQLGTAGSHRSLGADALSIDALLTGEASRVTWLVTVRTNTLVLT